eukprot:2583278-Prymnesium_polylepis.1
MLVCESVSPGPLVTPSSEKDVEEVECGAAEQRETLPVRATPATPRPPPRPLTRPCRCIR